MLGNEQFINLSAAADYMGNGAIFLPEFQSEITDIVRRNSIFAQRIAYVPATGAPSRWFDQTAISDGAFSDPRTIAVAATSPTRVEKSVTLKAITNQINYSLFDMEVMNSQATVFNQLKSKDMSDMINGITRLHAKALWNGTDTVSGNQIGNGGLQYVGVVNQIAKTQTIASTASILDSIRTQVANMVNDPLFTVKPSAIFMNPIAIDYLEQEIKNSNNAIRYIATDITGVAGGLNVMGVNTVAGLLPIYPEPYLVTDQAIPGISAAPGGQHNYPFCIVSEDLIEYHYVQEKQPRVFQMGKTTNLNESYVGVMFGAPVVKLAANAHTIGVVQRA
jgi:hypothetical protein